MKINPNFPAISDILRAIHKKSFYEFVKYFWGSVDSSPFIEPAPHIEAICRHIQLIEDGKIDNLSIEIPPGHGKSRVVAVLYHAWAWGPLGKPHLKLGFSTYAHKLTKRDCKNARNLLKSKKYQELYGHCFKITTDEATSIENDKGGVRTSMSTKGFVTGLRFHRWFGDDLLNAPDIRSKANLLKMSEHLEAVASREDLSEEYHQIIIGQRLGMDDAGAYARSMGYTVLSLPAEFDPARRCTTPFFTDWRTKTGEVLFPAGFNATKLANIKKKMHPLKYAAQYNQNPTLTEGNIFRMDDFKIIERNSIDFSFTFQSIDAAASEKEGADTSAISTWGVFYADENTDGGIILLDTWSDRVGISALFAKIRQKAEEWNPRAVVIENKSAGISVIPELQKDHDFPYPVISFEPGKHGKEERAMQAYPFAFRGHVYLYKEDHHAEALLAQLLNFPNGKVIDLADSAVQAFLHADATYTFKPLDFIYEGSSSAKKGRARTEDEVFDDGDYDETDAMDSVY